MAGSPRGASCLPCTAQGLEGSVWKFVGGVLVREWGGGGVPEVISRPVAMATALQNRFLCISGDGGIFLSLSLPPLLSLLLSMARHIWHRRD